MQNQITWLMVFELEPATRNTARTETKNKINK